MASLSFHVDYFSADAHGGALVNLIHGYTDNGDPFVRQFTDQLLEEARFPNVSHSARLTWRVYLRYPSLSLLSSTNGFFQGNYMTLSPSSL
jgi:hypothetical protein